MARLGASPSGRLGRLPSGRLGRLPTGRLGSPPQTRPWRASGPRTPYVTLAGVWGPPALAGLSAGRFRPPGQPGERRQRRDALGELGIFAVFGAERAKQLVTCGLQVPLGDEVFGALGVELCPGRAADVLERTREAFAAV